MYIFTGLSSERQVSQHHRLVSMRLPEGIPQGQRRGQSLFGRGRMPGTVRAVSSELRQHVGIVSMLMR